MHDLSLNELLTEEMLFAELDGFAELFDHVDGIEVGYIQRRNCCEEYCGSSSRDDPNGK